MFGKWKKKKMVDADNDTDQKSSPAQDAMRETISERESEQPLLRAQITSRDITANALEMVKDERGVRIETVLGILGSLAGFSASYAMMHEIMVGNLKIEAPEVAMVDTQGGERYLFGDYINRKLLQGEVIAGQTLSVWQITAGMVQHLGGNHNFDWEELFRRTAASIGKPEFGRLNIPEQHQPGDSVQNYVELLFPKFLPILQRYELPVDQYFLAFSLSVQEVMQMGKDALVPETSLRIVMECAVPASKIDSTSYFAK